MTPTYNCVHLSLGYSWPKMRPFVLGFRNHMRLSLSLDNFRYNSRNPGPRRRNHISACEHVISKSTDELDQLKKPQNSLDYRELGIQQEIFINSKYSPGSPILLPKGTRIFNKLVEYLRMQYDEFGFQEVISPIVYKSSLWKTSGHVENYADDMYSVTGRGAYGTQNGEQEGQNEDYGLKPMNCPGHCLIFASKKRSYRDLPLRYAEFSPLHRNEIAGALSGLSRVRRFHQDDGHIFCRPSQIQGEIQKTLDFMKLTYKALGIGQYRLALSTRPQDAFIGSVDEWDKAESALTKSLQDSGVEWTINERDGAFYGPKIDIIIRGADGREHQTATIQLDFQLPKRFQLNYQAPAPKMEQIGQICTDPELIKIEGQVTPVLIHRAILGSVERIMAILIDYYKGFWPFWLNPNQVVVITVNDSPEVLDYAHQTKRIIQGLDNSDHSVTKRRNERGIESDLAKIYTVISDKPVEVRHKIAAAKRQHYGIIVLVGPRDVKAQTISVDFSGIPNLNEYTDNILRKIITKAKHFQHGDRSEWEDDNLDVESVEPVNRDTKTGVKVPNQIALPAKWLRSILQELQRAYS